MYKLDRLGRETRLTLEAVAELEKYGVRVRSMTEEFDTATATGKLMLTMLSGFAAHEHAVIRERSVAGANRLAQAGAWMGGIVPYGYRKEGEKAKARLVISEEPIPTLQISEAEVIRTIFWMTAVEKKSCKVISYYRCNGKHGTRGLFGEKGQRCPSKDINGEFIEHTIWEDIENFLRNPGTVIEQLQKRIAKERSDSRASRDRLRRLEDALEKKTTERDRILGLFRKGRINEDALEVQMEQIETEEAALRANIDDLSARLQSVEAGSTQLASAGALLARLRARLDEPLSWELKRQLVEKLVAEVRVDTVEQNGKRSAAVAVTNCTFERVHRPPQRWAA